MFENDMNITENNYINSELVNGDALPTDTVFRDEIYRDIRILRKILVDFSINNNYDKFQLNIHDDYHLICMVIYCDGSFEELSLHKFDILMTNETWRSQVLFLQSYIPDNKPLEEHYNLAQLLDEKDRNEVVKRSQAHDILQSMCKFATKAYSLYTDNIMEKIKLKPIKKFSDTLSVTSGSIESKESDNKFLKFKVHEMSAKFRIDPNGKLFFLFTEYVGVELEHNSKEVEDFISIEKKSRITTAAHSIAKELLELMKHGQRRGLSAKESFDHFDKFGNGYIDADLLVEGCSKLGIGITYPVSVAVIQCIGGVGVKYITLHDMEIFMSKSVDKLTLEFTIENDTLNKKPKKSKKLKNGNIVEEEIIEVKDLSLKASQVVVITRADIKAEKIKKNKERKNVFNTQKRRAARKELIQFNDNIPIAKTVKTKVEGPAFKDKDGESTKLTNVYKEMNWHLHKLLDELLNCGEGIIMTYRLITNEINEESELSMNGKGFVLVVIPDLFMTLESMHIQMKDLLISYPYAKIVLVGLPGMPNTVYPEGWILNADLHSKCIAKLLDYLQRKEKFKDDDPVYFMGFGSGVYYLSKFISEISPDIGWLKYRIKVVCIVNGMLKFNKTYKQLCKELRQALLNSDSFEVYQLVSSLHFYDDYLQNNGRDEMLKVFWSLRKELCADSVEVKMAGKGYIGVLEHLKLVFNNKDTFDGASMLQTSLPIVVVQSTEDVFVTPQHTSMYKSDNLPPERHLVYTTSECLTPGAIHLNWLKAGHEILQERTPYILGLISNIAQVSGIKPVDIDRVVKKGPNIFIDDDAFDVISLAFQLKQNHEDTLSTNEKNRLQAIEDEKEQRKKDAIERAERLSKEKEEFEIEQLRKIADEEARLLDIKNKAIEAQRLLAEEVASKKSNEELERKRIAMEEDQKRREAKAARIAAMKKIQEETKFYEAEKSRERNETALMGLEDEHCRQRQLYEVLLDLAERKKNAIEKNRLRLIAEEESLKQLAIQMKERMEVRRQKFNNLLDNISQSAEVMGKDVDKFDDNVSTLYVGESMTISTHKFPNDSIDTNAKLDIIDENATTNSEFNYIQQSSFISNDIDSNTVDSSDSTIDNNFSMNFSGIKQGVDGEDTVFNTVNDELQQQSSFISNNDVDYDKFSDSNIVAKQVSLAFNKMSEIWYIRCEHVECLIRENSIGYDLNGFNKVVESAEIDVSRLSRAIGLIAQNPSLVGANSPEEVEGEIADLNRTLEQKENILRNLQNRKSIRKHHIKMLQNHSNKIYDQMMVSKGELDVIILQMLQLDTKLTAKTRKLKMEKEQFLSKRENTRFMQLISQQKVDLVEKEIERLKTHKHKYVDSCVIVSGLTQRSKTEQLRKYLRTVLHLEQEILDKAKYDVEVLSIKILNQTDLVLIGQRDNKKLFDITKDLKAHLVRFDAQTSQDIATGHETKLKDCIEVVKRRNKNTQISKIASSLGVVDSIALIRIKDMELRTKDERIFIGFDIIMNPELYQHLTDIDREQMRFDKNYHTELSKADLDRIMKLPTQISLVLPFLHSQEEIDAHRILNYFHRQLTDKIFQEKDYLSEGALIDNDGETVESSLVSKVTEGGKIISNLYIFDTLTENDTMMKESTRHFIRCKEVGYELEIDERAWLQLDEELCRYVFEPTERSQRLKLGFPIEKTWKCPFDKNTLRAIWKADKDDPNFKSIIPEGTSIEDAIYCRRLIDDYYVDDEESTIGQQRIVSLHELSCKIIRVMKLHDNNLREQIDFTRQEVKTIQDKLNKGIQNNDNDDTLIKRIWGSWEEVSPASYGKESQSAYFMSSSFDATRDNPAAFAIHSDSFFDDKDDLIPFEQEQLPTDPFELRNLGVKILTSFPGHANFGNSSISHKNDPNSKWAIYSSIRELSVQDPRKLKGKSILIQRKEPFTLLTVTHAKLITGQSRSHRFLIPNKDDSRILNVTVSVIFQGEFVRKGYSPARIAAGLFRLPDSKDPYAPLTPQPVGYAPYFMQSPNLPESLGKLTIIHRPRARPLKSGMFQLIIGCAADSNYSIQVMGECAQVALPIIDQQINIAKQNQRKLTSVLLELDTIKETIELTKFKQELCVKMIKESEAESSRTHKGLIKAQKAIELDNEEMTMFEEERKQTEKELKVFEKDYGYWSKVFSSRAREKQDIDTGVTSLNALHNSKLDERNKIKQELTDARSDLPACFSILRSFSEATQVATLLNTTMNTDLYQGTGGNIPILVKTPAEDLRSRMKLEGFKNLITEEQQWIVLDQSLNPSKYEWLREKEEADAMEYEALGQKPEVVRLDPAVSQYKMAKVEIEHIIKSPFSMLNRTEMIVRKLISKYHDDPKKIKDMSSGPTHGFDAHLADRVRNKHPLTFTKEEVEWISIDQILHADIWKYYVKYDEGICIDKDRAASNVSI
jgi:multidrug efflux pump subunit AcrA (membrane-fusion protein)